MCRKVFQK